MDPFVAALFHSLAASSRAGAWRLTMSPSARHICCWEPMLSALHAAKAGCLSRGATEDSVSSAILSFAKFVLQSAPRKLTQLAFGMKNKRLPAPIATALHGRERVHG